MDELSVDHGSPSDRGTIQRRCISSSGNRAEMSRIAKNVVPRKPDVVFIGGISQKDIESIREVIIQLRAALPDMEILLATGTQRGGFSRICSSSESIRILRTRVLTSEPPLH